MVPRDRGLGGTKNSRLSGTKNRRLGGSKRRETVWYAEVGGWLVPRDGLGDTERYAEV